MATILITGIARGIGHALAERFAANGDVVVGIDREPAATIYPSAVADVTDAASLRAAAADLERRVGPIDTLIANAGIGAETSGLRFDAEVFRRVIDVNLIGVANSISAVLPGMLQRRRGHIAAISSLASFGGIPRMLAYCASKSGVRTLMDGLRVEVAPMGVTTTTVCPGWIRTAMTAHVAASLPDILELDGAADRIYRAIASKKAFVAFPAGMAWKLRFLAALPTSWRDGILGRMASKVQRTNETNG